MLTLVDYGEIVIFICLAIASIVALAVILDRYFFFRSYTGRGPTSFLRKAVALLRNHDFSALDDHIRSDPDNVYSRFIEMGLKTPGRGRSGFTDRMQSRVLDEELLLEKRLTVLNTLGNNAPFIGLLGTVLGVIKAFHGLGILGSAGADLVMRSISRALLATAAGLGIAIPVVMSNNYFARKIKTIMKNLEIVIKELNGSLDQEVHADRKKAEAPRNVQSKRRKR